MKVVILAGGRGSRLEEETVTRPKPMVEIGEHPILWHIMKHYSHFGFSDFIIALGYKGEIIKRYFMDYYTLSGSLMVDLNNDKIKRIKPDCENWLVHLAETGLQTNTGGRIKRLEPWLSNESFMLTYGDGVSNINIYDLVQFHKSHGRIATITAVRPPARFGGLVIEGDMVERFTEKARAGEGWINGGYMVFEPGIFDYISGDGTSLEVDALHQLALDHQLAAYRHDDFWQCMDTIRDKNLLEELWHEGDPPWKVWQ